MKKENFKEYLQDEYITQHTIGENYKECIHNLFKLHHESINAWTMIFSNIFTLFIALLIFIKSTIIQNNIIFILILHVSAYTIHTPFSVCYHIFNCINKNELIKWRKYDIYGIFVRNIILSFTLSFFTYNNFKYTLLNTLITILIVCYSLLKFKENENNNKLDKIQQGKLIGYTVLSYLTPVLYNVYLSIINRTYDLTFKISLILIFSVILGGCCYCFRIPDIFFKPGTFNKIGTSHNFMHFFVILGSICEILYVYEISKKRKNYFN